MYVHVYNMYMYNGVCVCVCVCVCTGSCEFCGVPDSQTRSSCQRSESGCWKQVCGTRPPSLSFSLPPSLPPSLSPSFSLSFSLSDWFRSTFCILQYFAFCSVLHRAVQRQDFSMMSCLIKLGADPLLANISGRSPVQLLALKVRDNHVC